MIDQHYLDTICKLLRLYKNTPRCVVLFLAGSLPGIALLHLRQLSLFSMICRLPQNLLHRHAVNYFSSVATFKGSWFQQIRNLCLMYDLPHPQTLLSFPLGKDQFKTLAKKHVISYWEVILRSEASSLKSLTFFHPNFMSLVAPHPIWSTAGNSPYKIAMATVQAKMLSGRYRSGALTRHWDSSPGFCTLSTDCQGSLDDLLHILVQCPALQHVRSCLINFTNNFISTLPMCIRSLLRQKCDVSNPSFLPFILDCSTDPEVILLCQRTDYKVLEDLFSVTRTWTYVIHRERLRMLGRWCQGGN